MPGKLVPIRRPGQSLAPQVVERKPPTVALSPRELASAWLHHGVTMEALAHSTGRTRWTVERDVRRAISRAPLPPIPCPVVRRVAA